MLEERLEQQAELLITPSVSKAWVVSMTAALFFFYEFVQLNMFGSIHDELVKHLNLGASQYGLLSAIYLIANVIFLIPAGYLLDRFSTKRIILIALALCILGTYMFSVIHGFGLASVARFLTGIGSAFCFVGCIRLASRWFPQEKMALVTGCIITIAMLGGFMAQTPMSIMINELGWQKALVWDAIGGIFVFAIIALVVQDEPEGYQNTERNPATKVSREAVMATYATRNNWYAALYTSCVNMPITLLGAVWGIPYLTRVHHFSHETASLVTSMLFFGIIVGSPLIGWISDTLRIRKPIMQFGAVATLLVSLAVMMFPGHDIKVFLALFFLMGFIASTQVLSYPLVTATNPVHVTATAVSIISFVTQGGGAIYQMVYGFLLDHIGQGVYLNGALHYASSAYQYAFMMIPAGALIALWFSMQVKDNA